MRAVAKFLSVLLVALTLSACATGERYDAQLDRWIGRSEKDLLQGWGIPDKQYQLDADTKMVSYVHRAFVTYPGTLSTCVGTVSGNTVFNNCAGGFPPETEALNCETIFTLAHGRVTRWGHKGNDCRS